MSNKPNHTVTALRAHLFETLEALRDKDNPMDLDRARAICNVAKEITDTARAETDFQKATGIELNSSFNEAQPPSSIEGSLPEGPIEPATKRGRSGVLYSSARRRAS
mgnify:CR=1 FL=1